MNNKSIKFFWWDIEYDEGRDCYRKEVGNMLISFKRKKYTPWTYEAAVFIKPSYKTNKNTTTLCSNASISVESKESMEDAVEALKEKVMETFGELSLIVK